MSLFSKIIRKEIPSSPVARGANWYAFLDIQPRRPGHTLVRAPRALSFSPPGGMMRHPHRLRDV